MSELYGYDFADALVRDLVTGNHVPMEQVIRSAEGTTLRPVVCEKCQQNWPCPPIVGYRNYMNDRDDVAKSDNAYDRETGATDMMPARGHL